MPTPTEIVCANLRAEMGRQRLTQAGLASSLNITQQSLSAKLSGKRPFSVEELAAAAAALGVPFGLIVTEHAGVSA